MCCATNQNRKNRRKKSCHASLNNGRAPPPTSFLRPGTDPIPPSQPFHNGASAKVANRATSLAAVGKYRRAMEALHSNPVASGRRVHEDLSRWHPQDDDDLADVVPDPFSLLRIKLRALEVDIMAVVVKCPRKSSPQSMVGGLKLFAR
jgi:hypothetical protein